MQFHNGTPGFLSFSYKHVQPFRIQILVKANISVENSIYYWGLHGIWIHGESWGCTTEAGLRDPPSGPVGHEFFDRHHMLQIREKSDT